MEGGVLRHQNQGRGEAIAKLYLGSAIPGLISKSALPVSLLGEVPQRSPASIGSIHDPT
ncbi:hypothetical protein [Laspinema olomoucense]|uniref:Uncharacterized protein n=1 Tax=Laspinema olomoucense D3b TaxID=2953688 RepID=A0ABT2N7E1_9CYAN|nr:MULTISPECIES: hypothetical protein [unclassified Laspinema]MCT7975052.1 hypothetical protein [Laspinema sp. D3d]MCT7978607.1 hypothetical protein [Laspinema sp. D3b]MCT7987160.1 hypothetical protein [Laspinema sp. D3a]MCT7992267.1 hypothetical protein [Laspinema sp. D3c]